MIASPQQRSKRAAHECVSASAAPCGAADHFVQFYEKESFLVDAVGKFVTAGLRQGGRALIIATGSHLAGIDRWLKDATVPVDALVAEKRYIRLDAAETLRRFCPSGAPDETLFREVVGSLVAELTQAGEELRTFGEMVALLWQEGKSEEAIRLEEFWNRLAADHRFNLFCAYPIQGFKSHRAARHFAHVCRTHQRVLPTEAFQPQIGLTDEQLRQIASLQQRAAALEAEVEERERTEQANRHMAAIIDGSDDAIISKSLNGVITSWNPGAERIFGYSRGEVIGKSITILIPPERLREEDMILARLRRGEIIEHYETVRQRKDGTPLDVSLTISPVRDANGVIVGASKIARNITEQKANAAALERARQQLARANSELEQQVAALRRLHELSSKSYAVTSVQALLEEILAAALEVNQTNKGLLSLTTSENDGLRLAASRGFDETFLQAIAFVPAGHGACGMCQFKRQRVLVEDVLEDPLFTAYRELARKAGFRAVHSTPLIARDGKLIGVLSAHYAEPRQPTEREMQLMDLYARHAADLIENARLREALEHELEGRKATAEQLRIAHDELACINRDLEERVRERTASLTDLLSQMETFSYTVSHDLRAPLRAMSGYARVLQSDYAPKLDEDGMHYIERIIRASERMNRLISDVLAYARINRDRLEMKPLSLSDSATHVVEHAAELHVPNAKIMIHPDAPPVLGNEAFLTQIFANLLGNAVKFIPPGRDPEVTVSFRREGDYVRTEVRDNGIGIKPEHQSRLFGLFERVNNDKRYDGTGIGLAIVSRAIERMGGAVGVVSDGVNGSQFWFTLRAVTNGWTDEAVAASRTAHVTPRPEA